MKILIIEDNHEFAQMLSTSLREVGFKTDMAMSGREGIKSALYYLPDLILLDYHLGDMTGYDVALGIKCMGKTAHIPFIVLSSLAADPLLIGGFKKMTSCRGALVKTQTFEEILTAIRNIFPAASDEQDIP